MKAREFLLLEKTLEPSTFYQLLNLQAFIKRLKSGGEFIDDKTQKPIKVIASPAEIQQLERAVSSFPPSGQMRKAQMSGLIPNVIGGVRLSTIFREPEFGGRGGVKGKELDTVENSKLGNVGPAVEAWKAIGIFSKLTNRTDEAITLDQLMSVKQELASSMNLEYKKDKETGKVVSQTATAVAKKIITVRDIGGTVSDTISIKINVPLGSFQRAMAASPQDKDLWGRIQGILKFINENNALKRYNKVFSTNNRIDPVKIAVVGGEGEKTDVKTSYLDPEQNYKSKKTIPGLTFSLKAASPKIDQSSGTTVEGIKKMFNILGLDDTDAVEAIKAAVYAGKVPREVETDDQISARYKALWEIFRMAGQKLEIKLARTSDQGEANFITHFLESLSGAMTKGENLTIVDFDAKGTYRKLNPKTIKNLASLVDLEARVQAGGGAKGHPYLIVYDKNSSKGIMQVRLEAQSSGRWTLHYELTDLINLAIEANDKARSQAPIDKKSAKVAPVRSRANKPVATDPKPALNISKQQIGQDTVDDIRFSGE
jgi:hypothetical protein